MKHFMINILLCASLFFLKSFDNKSKATEPVATSPGFLTSILWFHTDFPPLSIIDGPSAGKGASDKWGHYLMDHMPEYKHEKIISNVARQHEEMKIRENACFRSFIKTPEREKYLYFSNKIVDLMPNGLIVLKERRNELRPYLNKSGELKLSELLGSKRFRVGVAQGRSFGAKIDAVLAPWKNDKKVIVNFSTGNIFYTGLVYLDKRQSIDGIIGYATELRYNLDQMKDKSSRFVVIPIAEDTSLVPISISCSRSPLGKKVIERINQVIESGGGAYATEAYRSWLPEDVRSYYDKLRNKLK